MLIRKRHLFIIASVALIAPFMMWLVYICLLPLKQSYQLLPRLIGEELPEISRIFYSPIFSPDGDGIYDWTSIAPHTRAPGDWTIEIQNSNGRSIRTFADPASRFEHTVYRGMGREEFFALSQEWDGRDNEGRIVPDGKYSIVVTVKNKCGSSSKRSQVIVDTKPPKAILEPLPKKIKGVML